MKEEVKRVKNRFADAVFREVSPALVLTGLSPLPEMLQLRKRER